MVLTQRTSDLWQLLNYKNPSKVNLSRFRQRKPSDYEIKRPATAILKDVQLSKLLAGQTCPPLSLQDFSHFTEHVEHSHENLQFYIEFLAYTKKWDALPESVKATSPENCLSKEQKRAASRGTISSTKMVHQHRKFEYLTHSGCIDEIDDEATSGTAINHTRVSTAGSMSMRETDASDGIIARDLMTSSCGLVLPEGSSGEHLPNHGCEMTRWSAMDPSKQLDTAKLDEELKCLSGIPWDPHSPLPLRLELQTLIYNFLLPSSPQQLNIAQPMLIECLYTLHHSSNPAGLWPVVNHIYYLLTQCTMPNFIRYTSLNATQPRQLYSLIAAMLNILLVTALTLLDIFTGKPKWMRAIGIPFFWWGCAALIAALEGFCFLLILRRQLQVNPYASSSSCLSSSPDTQITGRGGGGGGLKEKVKRHVRQVFCKNRKATGKVRWIQNAVLVQCIVKGFFITLVCSVIVGFIPNYK